ncbi:DUF4238 domain-containing protein [Maricaulis sp.]|uniref:DUF4238 domain-containing protein n=1 Tax=Maricaulis sp. TaxID=1486257 RepID=UPI00262E0A95|nr:DUF4238 domain-containing protein [Maricaulis sp.]
MAGRKHHFIPRFFLKGFGAPEKPTHLWRLTQAGEPKLVNMTNLAAQRDFYGAPGPDGTSEDDDRITVYERSLIDTAEALRSVAKLDDQLSSNAARLLAHLLLRAKHLRVAMYELQSNLFNDIVETVSEPEFLKAQLFGADGRMHEALETGLLRELAHNNVATTLNVPTHVLQRIVRRVLREKADTLLASVETSFEPFREYLDQNGLDIAREAHLKALRRDLAPSKRTEEFAGLEWEIINSDSPSIILPDCIGLAVDRNGNWSPALLNNSRDQGAFIFPVSSRRVLVAHKGDGFEWNAETYAQQAMRLASEFVLAPTLGQKTPADYARIGSGTLDVVQQFVDEAKSGLLSPPTPQLANPPIEIATDTIPSIPVAFHGGGDKEEAHDIANSAAMVARAYHKYFPLNGLDGITFTDDLFHSARAFADEHNCEPTLPSNQEEHYITSSVTQTFEVDGITKSHPIIHSSFGRMLLDEQSMNFGIQAVAGALGPVILTDFRARYTQAPEDHIDSDLRRALSRYNFCPLDCYFSQRLAAGLGGEDHLESEVDTYSRYLTEAVEGMVALLTSGEVTDPSDVFHPGLGHAINLGHLSARIAGFLDAVGTEFSPPSALVDALREADLFDWFLLFRSDLQEQFDALPYIPNPSTDPMLDHLDRLLMALLIWVRLEDEGLWVQWWQPGD